jgi:hypothetical protein
MSKYWSRDLCSQFLDYANYKARGIGTAVIHRGKLITGASSYTVYDGGFELKSTQNPI